jgi:hypothetical protein
MNPYPCVSVFIRVLFSLFIDFFAKKISVYLYHCFAKSLNSGEQKDPPHPNRSAVFDPELRPKGAHVEALPLSFDPEALDGEGGGEGGGDSFWLRRSRAVLIRVRYAFCL